MAKSTLEECMSVEQYINYCCVEWLERQGGELNQAVIDVLECNIQHWVKQSIKQHFLARY